MKINSNRVFISGASRGIGKSIATSFKESGAYVIGSYTGSSDLDKTICDEWVKADFSKKNDINRCANYLAKAKVDILINNAAYNKNYNFSEIPTHEFLKIQQVNLIAPFLLMQAILPYMKKNKWGRVVNISSILGKVSIAGRASYSASKFALEGMSLAAALEYSEFNVLINCVAPGFINTEMTKKNLNKHQLQGLISKVPMKRLGSADEVAKFVMWLASNQNTFITGQNIAIDGGFICG